MDLKTSLNKPALAFQQSRGWEAWILVIITILCSTVFDALLQLSRASESTVNWPHVIKICAYSVLSYIGICIIFWLVFRILGSRTPLSVCLKTWGITFYPNILCAIIVTITERYFYVFWNSLLWGMVLSVVFFGILIWKIALYILFLIEVGHLTKGRLIFAFGIIAVSIGFLAAFSGYIGIKTPIL